VGLAKPPQRRPDGVRGQVYRRAAGDLILLRSHERRAGPGFVKVRASAVPVRSGATGHEIARRAACEGIAGRRGQRVRPPPPIRAGWQELCDMIPGRQAEVLLRILDEPLPRRLTTGRP